MNKSFDGQLISEACGDEASVGMRSSFIGASVLKRLAVLSGEVNWDAIDCHRCRMLGWVAGSEDEEETRFIHLRPMGSSQKGILTGRVRGGFGQYFMGTSWYYMAASALYRMTRPPLVLGGLAMAWGYVKSAIQRRPRYDDEKFRRYLKSYHLECLLYGKATATRRANAAGEQTWLENRRKTEVV